MKTGNGKRERRPIRRSASYGGQAESGLRVGTSAPLSPGVTGMRAYPPDRKTTTSLRPPPPRVAGEEASSETGRRHSICFLRHPRPTKGLTASACLSFFAGPKQHLWYLSATFSGRNSMVECKLPKLNTGVRFPSPAPFFFRFCFSLPNFSSGDVNLISHRVDNCASFRVLFAALVTRGR